MTMAIGLFATILIVGVSILGLLGARRWMKAIDLKTQHDISDPYSQFVAMLFAVLLGFMVADAMQRFGDAKKTVQQEASALGNVYRLAEGLENSQRDKIRTLCKNYATEVVNDEWPKLTTKQDSPRAWTVYKQLWTACTTYEPVTQRQSNAQQLLLSAMESVGDNRRMRVEALHSGLPTELWLVLILGGASTIVFTYFFGVDNLKIQLVMVGIVSLVICLNLFLLVTYDDPFSGDVMVTPTAFETQLRLYSTDK
ncbi:DUF4239 domain-containing protein [bacterium]|nr:DUF4239 domain-containing protein [bacterium]MBP9810062.1 DUF4239 domain-containing protein [bacterium]